MSREPRANRQKHETERPKQQLLQTFSDPQQNLVAATRNFEQRMEQMRDKGFIERLQN